jgi:surfeit locus 1 family protein
VPDTSFTTGLRNLMYALQWWVFGGFVVFMWWRILREDARVA